jgi:hypothetical protein
VTNEAIRPHLSSYDPCWSRPTAFDAWRVGHLVKIQMRRHTGERLSRPEALVADITCGEYETEPRSSQSFYPV